MQKLSLTRAQAEARLFAADGVLSQALIPNP